MIVFNIQYALEGPQKMSQTLMLYKIKITKKYMIKFLYCIVIIIFIIKQCRHHQKPA